MIVFLNGQFVPEEQAVVSVFDRSFLYGDGLFETIPVWEGHAFRWEQHLDRLQRGAQFLGIRPPFSPLAIKADAAELLKRNGKLNAILRITLSRGVGARGYSPRGAKDPVLVMSIHPPAQSHTLEPARWRLIIASVRVLANDPVANFKTSNKLCHVLARAEADAQDADDALLLNTDGAVAEATSANSFWVDHGTIFTPPLASGALAGVTRAVLLEICSRLGVRAEERTCDPKLLDEVDGVFLSLSSYGLVEGVALNGRSLKRSPLVQQLHQAYQQLLKEETRAR